MKQDKNTFVESRKSEIEMEKAFIKSCDVLKKHAMKWDGKVMNVRFAKAMDEEINKVVKFFGRNGCTRKTIDFYIEKSYGDAGIFTLRYIVTAMNISAGERRLYANPAMNRISITTVWMPPYS